MPRLPPHTPRQLLDALAANDDLRRRLARGWIVVGALGVTFLSGMAIAHYGFGMPIEDANTGAPSTPANTLAMFGLMGAGFGLFFVLGLLLYRWRPRR